jgi:hypothetical protein
MKTVPAEKGDNDTKWASDHIGHVIYCLLEDYIVMKMFLNT